MLFQQETKIIQNKKVKEHQYNPQTDKKDTQVHGVPYQRIRAGLNEDFSLQGIFCFITAGRDSKELTHENHGYAEYLRNRLP
jgi:hypothetical protein